MKKIKKLDFGVDDPNLKQPNFDGYERNKKDKKLKLIISGICVGLAIGSFVLITTFNKDYAKISSYKASVDSQSLSEYEQGVLDSMRIRLQKELASVNENQEESNLDIYYLEDSVSLAKESESITDQSLTTSTESIPFESNESLSEITTSSSVNFDSSELIESEISVENVSKGLDESTVTLIDWKNVTNKETYAKDVSKILTSVFGPVLIEVIEDDVILVITDIDNAVITEIITDSYSQIFGKTSTIKTQKN